MKIILLSNRKFATLSRSASVCCLIARQCSLVLYLYWISVVLYACVYLLEFHEDQCGGFLFYQNDNTRIHSLSIHLWGWWMTLFVMNWIHHNSKIGLDIIWVRFLLKKFKMTIKIVTAPLLHNANRYDVILSYIKNHDPLIVILWDMRHY